MPVQFRCPQCRRALGDRAPVVAIVDRGQDGRWRAFEARRIPARRKPKPGKFNPDNSVVGFAQIGVARLGTPLFGPADPGGPNPQRTIPGNRLPDPAPLGCPRCRWRRMKRLRDLYREADQAAANGHTIRYP